MRSASKSPLRASTPHRGDDAAFLRQENERLKSELSVLKDMCTSERLKSQEMCEKLEHASEFKYSVESSLHGELKRQAEMINRLRDEIRKKDIANAEMAVKLSEQEQTSAKFLDEYRMLGETLSSRNERLVRAEKENKLLGRQHEERQRLLEALSVEKAGMIREMETLKGMCKGLKDEKDSLQRQLQDKAAQYTSAVQHFGQDRDLLIWESASRTRVLASARIHFCLLQVFRVKKKVGYEAIYNASTRFIGIRNSLALFRRSVDRLRLARCKLAFQSLQSRHPSQRSLEKSADWARRLFTQRLERCVMSQWRVLSTRRRKCRIILKLFLQATHKAFINTKKGLVRVGWKSIVNSAKTSQAASRSIAKLCGALRKAVSKLVFQQIKDSALRARLAESVSTRQSLSRAFYGLVVNAKLQHHRDSLQHFCALRKAAEDDFRRKAGIFQVLLSAKDFQRCVEAVRMRRLAAGWTCIKHCALHSRERRKRAVTAANVVAKLRDERLLFVMGKCFLAWKDVKLQQQLDSLVQEVETEKPLRQYYQTTSQEFGADLLKSKRHQSMNTLLSVLHSKVQCLRASALSQLKRYTIIPKKALRKLIFLFRGSLAHSFVAWRRKVSDLNLAGLCEDQAKERVFNENLLEHVSELESVIQSQMRDRAAIVGRRLGNVCLRVHQNTRRNWLGLWRWVAHRNTNMRNGAKLVARVATKHGLRRGLTGMQENNSKSSQRRLRFEEHQRKQTSKALQAKAQIVARWRYLIRLKKIIVKLIVKYSGRKTVHTKTMAVRVWQGVLLAVKRTDKEQQITAIQSEYVGLRGEMESLQAALANAQDISQLYENTILKLAQRRMIVGASVSLKMSLNVGWRKWISAIHRARAREKAAKRLLLLSKRGALQSSWKLWVWRCSHTDKQLRASQVRDAYAGQEAVRQLLSEVELQRNSDVTTLTRSLQDAEAITVRRELQLHALIERSQNLQETGQWIRKDKAIFKSWKYRVAHYRFAVSKLFRLTSIHIRARGLARFKTASHYRSQQRARALSLLRMSSAQTRRTEICAFYRWVKTTSQTESSLLHQKIDNGEFRINALRSNLDSVKKKLHWKAVISVKEKRRWTVLHAWQRVALHVKKLRAASASYRVSRRQAKLSSALRKLKIDSSRRATLRKITNDCLSTKQRKVQSRILAFMRRTVQVSASQRNSKLTKGARLLELKLRKKLESFSFSKLVRVSCVLKVHQRWKLKSGLNSLKRWLKKIPQVKLTPTFQHWRRIAVHSTAAWSALRRITSATHRRSLHHSLLAWHSRTTKAHAATFSTVSIIQSQAALYEDLQAERTRAQLLREALEREGLAAAHINRLVETGERLVTAVTASALKRTPVDRLSGAVVKETRRVFKRAAAKAYSWMNNWGVSHAFAVWRRTTRWLSNVPKKDMIQALKALTPPVGNLKGHVVEKQKQFVVTKKRGKVVAAVVLKLILSGKLHSIWATARHFVLVDRLASLSRQLEDKSEDITALRQSRSMLEREKAELIQVVQQQRAEGTQSEAVTKVLRELTTEREKLAEELAHRSFTIRKLLEENAGLSVKLANAQMEAEKLILLSQENYLPAEREGFSSPLRFDDLKSNS